MEKLHYERKVGPDFESDSKVGNQRVYAQSYIALISPTFARSWKTSLD